MKLINSFYTITLLLLLVVVYSSIAIGDNHVIERYAVKINGTSFSNNVATNILFYITNGNDNAIKAYDNV
ncbi:MAG: hypothetical protein LBJ98_04395 [Endomicrobium sp.]|jgi:hypothetical protein|nr:hypothetical protein [Endomicrobium sp.]